MTRFDADAPADRQKLFAEGIAAHRERGSAFVTFEAYADASASGDVAEGKGEGTDAGDGDETDAEGDETRVEGDETGAEDTDDELEQAPPWVQFADGVLNFDCTDEELDDLKSLLGEFPAFKVDELNRPEEVEGVNVRVSALADPNRVGQCVERVFREVYDQPEGYTAWVTEL